jgi:hypothetical protein
LESRHAACASPQGPDRPARRRRAAGFETLDRTHAQVLQVLKQFDRLLQHLDDNGADAVARPARRRSTPSLPAAHASTMPTKNSSSSRPAEQRRRRTGAARQAPAAGPRLAGGRLARTGAADRGHRPGLQLVRPGHAAHALPIFTALYHEHIALEESLIYPEAKRRQQALAERGRAARVLAWRYRLSAVVFFTVRSTSIEFCAPRPAGAAAPRRGSAPGPRRRGRRSAPGSRWCRPRRSSPGSRAGRAPPARRPPAARLRAFEVDDGEAGAVRPTARGFSSATYCAITPASSSAFTRRRQADGDRCTRSPGRRSRAGRRPAGLQDGPVDRIQLHHVAS